MTTNRKEPTGLEIYSILARDNLDEFKEFFREEKPDQKDLGQYLRIGIGYGYPNIATYLVRECKVDVNQVKEFGDLSLLEFVGSPYGGKQTYAHTETLFDLLINAGIDIKKPKWLLGSFIAGLSRAKAEHAPQLMTVIKKIVAVKGSEEKTPHNHTPLMLAAEENLREICFLLLDHGADITARNKKQETAISLAAKHKDPTLMQELIQFAKKKNCNLSTACGIAIINARWDVENIQFLLANGADINAVDDYNKTALYRFAERLDNLAENLPMIKTIVTLFLNAGINLEVRSLSFNTDTAEKEDYFTVLEYIQKQIQKDNKRELFQYLLNSITEFYQAKQVQIRAALPRLGLFPGLVTMVEQYALDVDCNAVHEQKAEPKQKTGSEQQTAQQSCCCIM